MSEFTISDFTIYFADYLEDNELPECLKEMPDDDSGTSFIDRLIIRNLYKEIGTETEALFKGFMENKARECINKYKWKIEQYLKERDEMLDKFVSLEESGELEEGKQEKKRTKLKGSTSINETTSTNNIGSSHIDGDVSHKTFLNPIDNSSTTLESRNDDDTDTTETVDNTTTGQGDTTQNNNQSQNEKSGYTITRKDSRTHQELYRAFKSMPEMIELTNNLELMYETALQSFDVLFMGVL